MKKALSTVVVLLVILSLLVVLVPAYLIQPFASQTQSDLDVSYALRRASPPATLAALLVGLVCAFKLWRSTRGWVRKSLLAFAGLLLVGFAILARENHFEWMFHPLPQPGYVEAAKARHVQGGDMVLSIEIGGDARAYPVPLLAYHHLVNTTVGGEPVVATY